MEKKQTKKGRVASFYVQEQTLRRLKDYAYTQRITISEALEAALVAYLDVAEDVLRTQHVEILKHDITA